MSRRPAETTVLLVGATLPDRGTRSVMAQLKHRFPTIQTWTTQR
jgi:hypothetical protein